MTQILEVANKDFKVATVTILNEVKYNMVTMNEKTECHQKNNKVEIRTKK